MTKRSLFLLGLAAILAAVYIAVFKDFFRSPKIDMIAQIRPLRSARAAAPGEIPVDPVSFAFDKKYQLTEIKVVAAADEATNKYPHVLWHLVTDSNSAPERVIVYGNTPKGMKPKIPKAKAEPLEPEVVYHIYVQAGKAKGDKKFHTRETVRPQ